MGYRPGLTILALAAALFLVSCATVSKRMPEELSQWHDVLTQHDPNTCRKYHYNFEREAPRLYKEDQADSLLGAIDYIKTECGPAANLEVTRLLLISNQGMFDDSLVGSATIPQMLWHRTEREYRSWWSRWSLLYGSSGPIDNTHENFESFQLDLARHVAADSMLDREGRVLGRYYSGEFDEAFNSIQADSMRGTALRRNYDEYVERTKLQFPVRGNIALQAGNWNPQGANRLLGAHPELAVLIGGETKRWRLDGVIAYRFQRAKNKYDVDSLGHIVSTDDFDSWLFGGEAGFKILDLRRLSTDIFVGLGYDVIFSIEEEGDSEEWVSHGSLATSFGVRQRFFLNERAGWYVGAAVRYSMVDYGNTGGSDLGGNTLTVSLVTGWSYHETLKQFLKNLNYQGNWRQ
ncbi:MAG: hypothetical protein RBT76_14780 [candidate division Zixibacteria bacterium]|nr:hypothetical protein [candidate division Zixibacteria bacterium]